MRALCVSTMIGLWAFAGGAFVAGEEPKKVEAKVKEIAGVAEFLRSVPKHFATLQAVDAERRRVTLLIDGDQVPKTWDLMPDAEVKFHGWWGRLEQITLGDRVWAWFQTDRKKQPVAIMMLADELSEQDIHDMPWTLTGDAAGKATLHPLKGGDRVLETTSATVRAGAGVGQRVYFQSAGAKGDRVRLLLGASEFEKRRLTQKATLRQRWEAEGLPGTVMFLHQHSGEMEFMVDHEGMRWARTLKTGDSVTLAGTPPIRAVVRDVRPWRERTQLRLVVAAADQGDLRLGQRTWVKVPTPSATIQEAQLPPDLNRRKDRSERIEWFLASIYCTCPVKGNICTGHFYTLASCNPNGCGQPNLVRQQVAKLIDEGKTDEQVFEALIKDYGPGLFKPHLLP